MFVAIVHTFDHVLSYISYLYIIIYIYTYIEYFIINLTYAVKHMFLKICMNRIIIHPVTL